MSVFTGEQSRPPSLVQFGAIHQYFIFALIRFHVDFAPPRAPPRRPQGAQAVVVVQGVRSINYNPIPCAIQQRGRKTLG